MRPVDLANIRRVLLRGAPTKLSSTVWNSIVPLLCVFLGLRGLLFGTPDWSDRACILIGVACIGYFIFKYVADAPARASHQQAIATVAKLIEARRGERS